MKPLGVVCSLVVLVTGAFGQHRSFGSVVFPGGTSSPSSGITRNFGSVVFPGGTQSIPVHGGPPVVGVRPGVGVGTQIPVGGVSHNVRRNINGRGSRSTVPYVYAYPTYVGGYGYDNSFATDEPAPPPQPNAPVVYPPQQQQRANPVMIQMGPDGEYSTMVQRPPATIYEAPRGREAAEEPDPSVEAPRYLLAFKDHTIYSAVAYWADGDTLHYFTTGNTHNQVSMSLIDRALTERLNRELGIDFKLPAAK